VPFRNIVGHRRIVSLLSRAIAHNTVPPALLLAGPEGVGKRRVAVALAETLNCLSPVRSATTPIGNATTLVVATPNHDLEFDACGTCASCRRIVRGVHPDVILLEPGETGTIKIDPIRDVVLRAGYRPFEARRRVVIIDDAEAMTAEAQSALLKVLEEPPTASVFLLVSSMPDALLPTVLSRCARLRFGRLTASEIAEVLTRDHDYTETEARAVAASSDGSIGRALQAESADLAEARATAQWLLEQTARISDPSRRVEAVKDLTGKKGSSAGERDQLAVCLRALSSLLRDLGILSTRADARMLANADLQGALERLVSAYDSARSMRAFTAVDRALAALERNASPKVVADWLVLQL
jgi:DNA polymerase-3 subunit delta'